jgi:hypothetical protein
MMSISIGILTLLLAVTINIYYVQISNINVVPNTLIILYLYCFVYIAYAVFQTFIVGESQYIQDRVCEKNKVVESSYTTKLFEKNDTKYNSMINHENMLPISIVHVVVTVSGF